MYDDYLALEAANPDELEQKIKDARGSTASPFIALALNDEQLFLRSFTVDYAREKDLKRKLQMEAFELLSLPVSDIVFDFQILHSDLEKINGVFVCMPQVRLSEYCAVIAREGLVPVRVTAAFLARLDTFFMHHSDLNERFCLLDFAVVNRIHLAVFNKKKCELLRRIPYENSEEAISETVQSLRSSSGGSSVKDFQHIYIEGTFAEKEQLIERVKRTYQLNVKEDLLGDITPSVKYGALFQTNLVRNFFCDVAERKRNFQVAHVVLALLAVLVLVRGINVMGLNNKVNELKKSFTAEDYSLAQELQREIKKKK